MFHQVVTGASINYILLDCYFVYNNIVGMLYIYKTTIMEILIEEEILIKLEIFSNDF